MTMTIGNRPDDLDDVLRFHRRLPAYAPTPLHHARELGMWIKDEGPRLGVGSFKILGASWAVYRLLARELDLTLDAWSDLSELRSLAADKLGPPELIAATEGNHGRAVARLARWLGMRATIFVPEDAHERHLAALRADGARLVTARDYEQATDRAADHAGPGRWLIQDHSWPGFETLPNWILDGYSTVCREIDDAIEQPPELVFAPVGVGIFAASVVTHFRRADPAPRIVTVEPSRACPLRVSLDKGAMTEPPESGPTVMAGLKSRRIATVAWPILKEGVARAVTVEDEEALEAQRRLAETGIRTGPAGAAAFAAASAATERARILSFVTEWDR
jgi:diaminopropionate ammonia-lyase